jgi:hypothetical protein
MSSFSQLYLPASYRSSVVREIAKTLLETEGQEGEEKRVKVLSCFNDVRGLFSKIDEFYNHEDSGMVSVIVNETAEHESITDILDLVRRPVPWRIVVKAARIPREHYKKVNYKDALNVVGDSTALELQSNHKNKMDYVWGDSLVYPRPFKGFDKFAGIVFFMVFKESRGKYS